MAAVAAFALSVAAYRLVFAANPSLWTHTDEWVYRAGGLVARQHPGALYQVRLGEPGQEQLPFTYPPFAALVFALGSGLSFWLWQIGLVVADIALLPVIAFTALRIAGHHGRAAVSGAVAVAAVSLWLEPVFSTMFLGQVNLVLLALVLADLALPPGSPLKGVGIGLAAGIKLTPLIFIPYLYATGRRRAAAVGLITFAATVGAGFTAAPAASRYFWAGGFRASPAEAVGLQDQSLNGLLQRLLHQPHTATLAWAVLALVVGFAGLAIAAIAARRGLELLGVVLCGVTGLLVSPLSWTHHWVWVVPALALLAAGHSRKASEHSRQASEPGRRTAGRAGPIAMRALGAAALLALFTEWPRRVPLGQGTAVLPWGLLRLAPHGSDREYYWHGATLLLGNAYVIAGLLAIAGSACYLLATRPGDPEQPDLTWPWEKTDRTFTRPVRQSIK